MSFGEDYVNGYAEALADVGEWPEGKREQNKLIKEALAMAKAAHRPLLTFNTAARVQIELLENAGIPKESYRRMIFRGCLNHVSEEERKFNKDLAALRNRFRYELPDS